MTPLSPGRMIRRAREERGVTQAQLAVRAGTTQSAISRLEADLLSPTVDHLVRIVACLGCELVLAAEPMEPRAERADLRAWQEGETAERLQAAVRTLGQLGAIAGSARDR